MNFFRPCSQIIASTRIVALGVTSNLQYKILLQRIDICIRLCPIFIAGFYIVNIDKWDPIDLFILIYKCK